MAYYQNDPYNENQRPPYGHANQYNQYSAPPGHHAVGNTGVANYRQGHGQDYDSQWETKSYQSSYHGSQTHLNPQEMVQVPSPMPNMPYQQQYPPPQRPGLNYAASSAGWSVVRDKLMKRRSVKHVPLFKGNLVLDVNVPSTIVPAGKQDVEEFSKMRYTAATCDPDDFMASQYSLRQYLWGRHTELFIVMTMYNEDEVLFVKTMNAYAYYFYFPFDSLFSVQCH